MTQEVYCVNANKTSPPNDNSFKSFICIFLVIIAICTIILLVIWGISRDKGQHPRDGRYIGHKDTYRGEEDHTAKTTTTRKYPVKVIPMEKTPKPTTTTTSTIQPSTEDLTESETDYDYYDFKVIPDEHSTKKEVESTLKTIDTAEDKHHMTSVGTDRVDEETTSYSYDSTKEKESKYYFKESTDNASTTEKYTTDSEDDFKILYGKPTTEGDFLETSVSTPLIVDDKTDVYVSTTYNIKYLLHSIIFDKLKTTVHDESTTEDIEKITSTEDDSSASERAAEYIYSSGFISSTEKTFEKYIEYTNHSTETDEDDMDIGNTTETSTFESTSDSFEISESEESSSYPTEPEKNTTEISYESLIVGSSDSSMTDLTTSDDDIIHSTTDSTTSDDIIHSTTDSSTSDGYTEEITSDSDYYTTGSDYYSTDYLSTTPLTIVHDRSTTEEEKSSSSTSTDLTSTTESMSRVTTRKDGTTKPMDTKKHEIDICTTSACKSTSSKMLSMIDFKKNPCENFYEFSCGGSKHTASKSYQEMLQHRVWTRMIDQFEKKTKHHELMLLNKFYKQCVDYDDLSMKDQNPYHIVYSEYEALGKFYFELIGPEAKEMSITKLLVQLMKRHSTPLFEIDLAVDGDRDLFVFKMTVPTKTYLFEETREKCVRELRQHLKDTKKLDVDEAYDAVYANCIHNYVTYINNVDTILTKMGFFEGVDNADKIIKDIRITLEWDILDVYAQQLSPFTINMHLAEESYIWMTVDEMNDRFSSIDWTYFFSELVAQPVPKTAKVQVYFSKFFDQLFRNMTTFKSKRSLHNRLLSMYIHDLYNELESRANDKNREIYCVQLASKLMPDLASIQYLNSFDPKELDRLDVYVKTLFSNLTATLIDSIDEGKVFEDETKIKQKVAEMEILTYSSKFLNYKSKRVSGGSNIAHRYSTVRMSDLFHNSFIDTITWSRIFKYRSWNKIASTNLWNNIISPSDISIKSVYSLNKVVVPFGLFAVNDYSYGQFYITMSKIGFQLAKGIAHHFDFNGFKYFVDNTIESVATFDVDLNECVSNVWSMSRSMSVDGSSVSYKMDFKTDINERVSDDTALKLTYDAIKNFEYNQRLPWLNETFNPYQLFYISVVQQFCTDDDLSDYAIDLYTNAKLPNRLRVDSFISNDFMFSDLFKCAKGATLNPMYKCSQFPYRSDDYDDSKFMTASR